MKVISSVAIMIVLILSALVGKVDIHLQNLLTFNTIDSTIFYQLRLPRVLLAFLAGGILALSGLIFQTLFRNPLTTPFTLGISGGATLGAAVAIIFGYHSTFMGFSAISFFAFLGALLTVALIYYFSKKLTSTTDHRLILVGIALSFFFSSLLLILYYLSDFEESYLIMRFTMGALDTVGYSDAIPLLFGTLLIIGVAYYYKQELKLLSISYEFAYLRGVNVDKMMLMMFVVISLAVGLLVSITGPIGFVGLIIPHIIKLVFKQSADRLLSITFICGGIFLVLCDTLSRALPTVSEVPVGIITSLIGGLIFIYILVSKD
ncbi:MAG TPA: iron ABC transporter permease [Campylobacterales bacterium]|nr:iron ABC transporter permease [Campylobacterales bacterium]